MRPIIGQAVSWPIATRSSRPLAGTHLLERPRGVNAPPMKSSCQAGPDQVRVRNAVNVNSAHSRALPALVSRCRQQCLYAMPTAAVSAQSADRCRDGQSVGALLPPIQAIGPHRPSNESRVCLKCRTASSQVAGVDLPRPTEYRCREAWARLFRRSRIAVSPVPRTRRTNPSGLSGLPGWFHSPPIRSS